MRRARIGQTKRQQISLAVPCVCLCFRIRHNIREPVWYIIYRLQLPWETSASSSDKCSRQSHRTINGYESAQMDLEERRSSYCHPFRFAFRKPPQEPLGNSRRSQNRIQPFYFCKDLNARLRRVCIHIYILNKQLDYRMLVLCW